MNSATAFSWKSLLVCFGLIREPEYQVIPLILFRYSLPVQTTLESLLVERAKKEGLLAATDAKAAQDARELLESPNLKLWRWNSKSTGKAHIFAELSDGNYHSLCGRDIDPRAPRQTIEKVRGDECHRCLKEARAILSRRS